LHLIHSLGPKPKDGTSARKIYTYLARENMTKPRLHFPYRTFERAVLSMFEGYSAALSKVLREKEAEQVGLKGQLAQERERAAHPLAQTWTEARDLITTLDNAPDPGAARLKLRALLRRIVESIWLLATKGQGKDRQATVQVVFRTAHRYADLPGYHGDPAREYACRWYWVLHRPPAPKKDGRWYAKSFLGGPDLRKPETVKLELEMHQLNEQMIERDKEYLKAHGEEPDNPAETPEERFKTDLAFDAKRIFTKTEVIKAGK
jgi:hypothetical protein